MWRQFRILYILMQIILLSLSLPVRADETIFKYPPIMGKNVGQDQLATAPKAQTNRIFTIYSTADNILMREVILDFQRKNPAITINYHEMQSIELFEKIKQDRQEKTAGADLAFSSAMDLQMKLANDGYAASLDITLDPALPSWAAWRKEAFGITIEPAVILYNKNLLEDLEIPRNRAALSEFLLENRFRLRERVGTYDIEKSGLGYLFFAGDLEQYSAMWELVRIFGLVATQAIASSSEMIQKVATGELALAYNVLGAYALPTLAKEEHVGIILPEDYTLVFSRIALVPKTAQNPDIGKAFIQYLLSKQGQEKLAKSAHFSAIHPKVKGVFSPQGLYNAADKNVHPLKVSPSLLVYLDQLKRRKILERWHKLMP